MGADTGARAKSIGNANADMMIPVVRNHANSEQAELDDISSLYLLAITVGIGARI